MSWFSKLKQILSPTGSEQLEQETGELVSAVDTDRKALQNIPSVSHTAKSALSPFASRILEKAKIEALKDDDERKKITSPAELFLTNQEAKMRVEDIKSRILEKSRQASEKFTGAAKSMPKTAFNAFAKPAEKDT